MSMEIVRRLMKSRSSDLIKESLAMTHLSEADEDEVLDDPAEEMEVGQDTESDSDLEGEDTGEEEANPDNVESPEEENEEATEGHANPLENDYAVQHSLGELVVLAYSNGNNSKLKGVIEGYDKEGFYRIKWANGLTTNGITDLAITTVVTDQENAKCVCGGSNFVQEGDMLVCDDCGRAVGDTDTPETDEFVEDEIPENLDMLTIADKNRPQGKKMIRSEAHPVSTANKPNISETIRKAFSKKSLQEGSQSYKGYDIYSPTEEGDYEVYIKKDGKDLLDKTGKKLQFNWVSHAKEYIDSLNESADEGEYSFSRLQDELSNEFWTRQSEMVADIEGLGYAVLEANAEYILVAIEDDEGEDHQMQIPVAGTSRTMTLDFTRAEIVL